jgi:hypothetical protein
MIEKLSGKVAYAVLSSGGFLAIGEEEHTIPWSKLTYGMNLGGYPWSNSRSSCPSSSFTRSGALNGFTPAAAT